MVLRGSKSGLNATAHAYYDFAMRNAAMLLWVAVWIAAVNGCGGASHQDRCRSSSDMPQGDMPCYEPPQGSPQHDKQEEKHTPPGNPMPAR